MDTHARELVKTFGLACLIAWLVSLNAQAQQPQLVVQAGHKGIVKALAVSPEGKILASAGADRTIILWDLVSGKELYSLSGHDGWIFALAFSKDGRLASGSYDGVVKIWNITTGSLETEITSVKPHDITSLAFSPNGDYLAIASSDKVINIWNVRTKTAGIPLNAHTATVTQVAFSNDGRTLFSSSLDGTLRFWNIATRESKSTGKLPVGITSFAVSLSGSAHYLALAAADGGSIGVFDFNAQEPNVQRILPQPATGDDSRGTDDRKLDGIDYRKYRLQMLGGSRYPAGAIGFVSDHELAFVDGYRLRVWDVATLSEKFSKEIKSKEGAYAVAFAPKTNQLIYSDGEEIKSVNPTSGEETQLLGAINAYNAVAFSSDSSTMMARQGGDSLGFWRVNNKTHIPIEDAPMILPSCSRDEKSSHQAIIIWKFFVTAVVQNKRILLKPLAEKDAPAVVLQAHTQSISRIATNEKETMLASAGSDGKVLLWDLATHQPIRSIEAKADILQFSPDGSILATGGENKLRLWSVNKPEEPPVTIDADPHRVIVFSRAGDLVAAPVFEGDLGAGFSDKSERTAIDLRNKLVEATSKRRLVLKVWKVTGELLMAAPLAMLASEFDLGAFLSTKSNFEPVGIMEFATFDSFETGTGSVAFSPHGNLIASAATDFVTGGEVIKLWNLPDGNELHTLIGHTASIRSIAFSPNGKILASVSWDRTLKLWDVSSGRERATLISFDKSNWVLFTPDGQFDTNLYLDDNTNMTWIWPGAALRPLPLRVFIRDYYEPFLFRKIMSGVQLPTARNLSNLNRTQPIVTITKIEPDGPDSVSVTVEVRDVTSDVQSDNHRVPLKSGVFDIKVFRDRKLVASSTSDEGFTRYLSKVSLLRGSHHARSNKESEIWRDETGVKLDAKGSAKVTFHQIKLPRSDNHTEFVFSAYAFNSDRIASETSKRSYRPPSVSAPTSRPRAYVITVGVDANQVGWSLNFAAKSAEDMRQLVGDKLAKDFDVISVPILATFETDSFRVALSQATRENIHAVFDALGGKGINNKARGEIPVIKELKPATPDDLILVYVASHGYEDPYGNFYIIPYVPDNVIGVSESTLNKCLGSGKAECRAERIFSRNLISGDDLALWWRDIDAGHAMIVLDSCFSASISGKDFKPGPLGDRSFGQLTYDKGMMLLAASQKSSTSTLGPSIDGSLLSDALKRYSSKYADSTIIGWLDGAEDFLPREYQKLFPTRTADDIQRPVLFDFRKDKR